MGKAVGSVKSRCKIDAEPWKVVAKVPDYQACFSLKVTEAGDH
jgi:hypothetical protein